MYFITNISTCNKRLKFLNRYICICNTKLFLPYWGGKKTKKGPYPFPKLNSWYSNLPQWIIRDRLLREPAASVISASPFELFQWIDSWLKAKYPCEGGDRSWNFFPLTSPRTFTFISIMSLLLEPSKLCFQWIWWQAVSIALLVIHS